MAYFGKESGLLKWTSQEGPDYITHRGFFFFFFIEKYMRWHSQKSERMEIGENKVQ